MAERSTTLRRDIQGLRGVAILMGVAYHSGHLGGGYVGFEIFFVVSGFLICRMLLGEHRRARRIDFRAFYARRFWRLVPALAATVLVTLLASLVVLSPVVGQYVAVRTAMGALLIHANYVIPHVTGDYFGPQAELNPFLHTWSLSLEEQVYLVFPALLATGLALGRRRRRWWWAALPLVAVMGVSLAWAAATSRGQVVGPFPVELGGYYGPASRFWEFGAGALLALVVHRRPGPRLAGLRWCAGWAGMAGIAAAALVIDPTVPYPSVVTLWPVCSVCVVIWAGDVVVSSSWSATDVLGRRTVTFLGDISYSWYLWHWPFISLTRSLGGDETLRTVAAVASLVPAYLSYRYIELPWARRGRGRSRDASTTATTTRTATRRRRREALAVLGVPLALAVSMLVVVDHEYGSARVHDFHLAAGPHIGDASGCVDLSAEASCQLVPVGATGADVVLWGDSNAEHLSEPTIDAGRATGSGVRLLVHPGCPPLDVLVTSAPQLLPRFSTPEQGAQRCRSEYLDALAWFRSHAPVTVVLGFGSAYARGFDEVLTPTSPQGPVDAETAFADGLRKTVETLRHYGDHVVIAQPILPFLETHHWGPSTCLPLTMLTGRCVVDVSLASAESTVRVMRAAIGRIGAQTGATVFDPVPVLCPHGRCSTQSGDAVLYRDQQHLSVQGALLLTSTMSTALSSAQGGPEVGDPASGAPSVRR